ncbi:hypothetical protein DFH06DRAFT_1145596 [Mycena polygramma]|nr:hypothetical protein DFH06DRAFT_1145596 [Mycena polygramma]
MNYTVDLTFEDGWGFTLNRAPGLSMQMLLYGIQLVLLSIAARLLYRWSGTGRKILVAATITIAILSTAQICLELGAAVVGLRLARLELEGQFWLPESTYTYTCIFTAKDVLLVTNRYTVASSSGGVEHASRVFGDDNGSTVPYAMAIATNVSLMVLTAGRIWWIRRDACLVLEPAHVRKYNTAIAIILESGAIYCLAGVAFLIGSSMPLPVPAIVEASLPQMMASGQFEFSN